jgi:hypothetical protein
VSKTPARMDKMALDIDKEKHAQVFAQWEQVRPASAEKMEEIQKQVETLLVHGVIEPARQVFRASPVTLVKKPDGKWRFCIDYRRLNDCCGSSAWPIPRIKELLERIGGKQPKYFGVIDLTAGYHQSPMDEASKDFTAFRTSTGIYYNTCIAKFLSVLVITLMKCF